MEEREAVVAGLEDDVDVVAEVSDMVCRSVFEGAMNSERR